MARNEEDHIGQVGGETTLVTVTPVLTSSTDDNYVTGDYVGTSGVPITFTNCARKLGGTGFITGATLIDDSTTGVAGELWIYDTTFTPPADSAAWTTSDTAAAADTLVCVIPFSTYYAAAGYAVSGGIPWDKGSVAFKCGAASRDLYGAFVTRGAPDYAIDSLTFRLSIDQD